jgi:hypothetical protein
MLSACESGLTGQIPGNELLGLTRALLYAGAAAAVVTLWSVDELSTSFLTAIFYRHVQLRRPGTAAVRHRPVQYVVVRLHVRWADVVPYRRCGYHVLHLRHGRLAQDRAGPGDRYTTYAGVQLAVPARATITYGTGGNVRSFGYDHLNRLRAARA